MAELFQTPTARLVVWLAVLLVLSIAGFYAVRRFRDSTGEIETTGDMLSNFDEMRRQGDLSEDEFRTIKTILAARTHTEIRRKKDSR